MTIPFGATAAHANGTFTDDDGNVHEDNIEALAARGITEGCNPTGTEYCPDDPVLRGQMAAFIDRTLDLEDASGDYFIDDEGSIFEQNINNLALAEITLGCNPAGTEFCENQMVPRGQMAAFIDRAFDLPPTTTDFFTDDDDSIFEQNINNLAQAGITLGCEEGLYCPDALVLRDQMASFIIRALAVQPETPTPPGDDGGGGGGGTPPANNPPTATDDSATTTEDTQVVVSVLDNDTDSDGDTLTVSAVTDPANGTTSTDGTTITYTPDASFTGTDTFDYTVADGNGGTDTGTVTVTVNAVSPSNNPPTATDDSATTTEDTQVVVSVLDNDTDSDGDTLTVSAVTDPANGTTSTDGTTITYTPDASFTGTDTFDYTVADGNGGTDTGTVTVTVNAAVQGSATVTINASSGIDASSFATEAFEIANTGDVDISSVTFDLGTAFFPDLVFDPVGDAGDVTSKCLEIASEGGTGYVAPTDPCVDPFSDEVEANGYHEMTLEFTDFGVGEAITFSVDVDPTTILGFDGAGNAGAISGLEMAASTVTVTFTDGTTMSQTFGDGSQGGSEAAVPSPIDEAVTLSVDGATLTDGAFSNGAQVASVDSAAQTAVIGGTEGTEVTLIIVDAALEDAPSGGFYDLDDYERNSAVTVTYETATIGADGTAEIPFSVSEVSGQATYLIAAATNADGIAGPPTLPVYLELQAAPPASGEVLYRVNDGGSLVAATDGGPDWSEDTLANPHSALVEGGDGTFSATSGSGTGEVTTTDSTVPSSTPLSVFNTERYDTPTAPEMTWSFDVTSGTEVEIRLYLAEIFDGITAVGERVFDVSVDGSVPTEFQDIDPYALAGEQHSVGTMVSTTVVSDGAVDLVFMHQTENPAIKAIELVVPEPQTGVLGTSSTSVDFGEVIVDTTAAESVTLTNLGETGDPSLEITSVEIAPTGVFSVTTDPTGSTVAPEESTELGLEFAPTSVTTYSADVTVTYTDGTTSTDLVIPLSGEGISSATVGFSSSGLSGESLSNPTSIDVGPDGRVYVSQQNGAIYAYTVDRSAANDYTVTDTEEILAVQNLPNHNDDGSAASGLNTRQVTGIMVEGTASAPVLYATSSDPRIGAGGSGDDEGLDTNSGVLSRLSWNCADGPLETSETDCWDHVQLVRGLPRSEENHSTNGLDLDPTTNTLYVMQGGHTNQGAPSNNFAGTPEYALSGALLSIDLDTLEGMTPFTDSYGNEVVYDLPTLAGTDAPFGGQNGANQAMWVADGPVQVYAPGFRNAYDVVFSTLGELYTFDNGPNGGWGGVPIGEGTSSCTNEFNNGGSTYSDNFHHITSEGYYGGHPNPTRAGADVQYFVKNSSGDWVAGDPVTGDPVPDSLENDFECDYLQPGVDDGSPFLVSASTNGMTEYTASNFEEAMAGDLLVASFNGNIYRVQLDASGNFVEAGPLFSGFGSTPLDVTAQSDTDIFPGTVWAVTYGSDNVTVFEPNDFGGGGTTCDTSDPAGDADGDGYTNEDEQIHGTDPCSAASVPADFDNDDIGNLTDDDDDNDGQLDTTDPFAIDPDNGTTTAITETCPTNETDPETSNVGTCLRFAAGSFPGTILDLGFTGLMTNESTDYIDLYNPDNLVAGGANPLLSVEQITTGDAYEGANDQDNGFQIGVDPAGEAFTAHTRLLGPNPTDNFMSAGMYIGDGTQFNYLKIVAAANDFTDTSVGIQTLIEEGDTATDSVLTPDADVAGDNTVIDLWLTATPGAAATDPWTVESTYSINGGPQLAAGTFSAPAEWFSAGTAVGVISTVNGTGGIDWQVDFDLLEVYRSGDTSGYQIDAGTTDTVEGWTGVLSDGTGLPSGVTLSVTSGGDATSEETVTAAGGYPAEVFMNEIYGVQDWGFAVPDGDYDVDLLFAETYPPESDSRLFDVTIEGTLYLDDYSVSTEAGGDYIGIVESFTVTVDDGELSINLLAVAENPAIKGIVITESGT